MSIEVHVSGPLFRHEGPAIAAEALAKIVEAVANEGKDLVLQGLGRSLRHPTGYYESQIEAKSSGSKGSVDDGNVVYGPWLEGTGSRNRTTRFKGYHTFLEAAEELRIKAQVVAERVMAEELGRLD